MENEKCKNSKCLGGMLRYSVHGIGDVCPDCKGTGAPPPQNQKPHNSDICATCEQRYDAHGFINDGCPIGDNQYSITQGFAPSPLPTEGEGEKLCGLHNFVGGEQSCPDCISLNTSPPAFTDGGELLPCPFCNLTPSLLAEPDHNGDTVLCKLGHVRMRSVEGWNTRAPSAGETELERVKTAYGDLATKTGQRLAEQQTEISTLAAENRRLVALAERPWIPVGERLPEVEGYYFVTHCETVDRFWWNTEQWERYDSTDAVKCVIAWRPEIVPYNPAAKAQSDRPAQPHRRIKPMAEPNEQEKSRVIIEMLGGCWHDLSRAEHEHYIDYACSKCDETWCTDLDPDDAPENPNLFDPAQIAVTFEYVDKAVERGLMNMFSVNLARRKEPDEILRWAVVYSPGGEYFETEYHTSCAGLVAEALYRLCTQEEA